WMVSQAPEKRIISTGSQLREVHSDPRTVLSTNSYEIRLFVGASSGLPRVRRAGGLFFATSFHFSSVIMNFKFVFHNFRLARRRFLPGACALAGALLIGWSNAPAAELDGTGTLWEPVMEWSFENPSSSGNPFDLVATATFVHSESGETRTTPFFYDGGDTWKVRFTATRVGTWTVSTASGDPDLDGKQGTVEIQPNPDPEARGFVVAHGSKFAKQAGPNGELEAFVP